MEIIGLAFLLALLFTFFKAISKENYHTNKVSQSILEEYGEPEESLFLQTDVFTIHQRSSITDMNNQIRFTIETDFPSLHDHTIIYDKNGDKISEFSCALFSFHDRHTITMKNGISFDLTSELFHFFTSVMHINELGWTFEGDFLDLNFTIKDSNDKLIAVVCQKVFSIHDRYCIDVYNSEYINETVTIVIVLQHILRRRRQNSSNVSATNS